VHNLIMLAATIAAACERPQIRSAQRVRAHLPAMIRFEDGTTAAADTRDLGRDGASITLRAPVPLSRRERVWVSLFCFDAEHPLPAEILEHGGRTLRIRFGPLDLEQETHLVRAIFSRADAWMGFSEGHRRDRPLLTLLDIARVGAAGLSRALALSLRPRPRALPPRGVPAPVRGQA
jgi:cellulose synthase (UDP-forming)